jgi:hypothetical protein
MSRSPFITSPMPMKHGIDGHYAVFMKGNIVTEHNFIL